MKLRSLIKLLRNVKVVSVKKGEMIIPERSKEKNIFFIRKGLVRSYMNTEKGDEITFRLYAEKQVFTNAHTVLMNQPSKFNYQALEPTKAYKLNYDSFMLDTSKNPDLLELSRTLFGKRVFEQAFHRIESFVFLSPEERYKLFVKENPNIINRAPDMYIANVLGITPVSLSRIRNRIASQKS